MTITAKYPGSCAACHQPIAAGSKIEWSKGSPAKHAACAGVAVVAAANPGRASAPRRSRGTWTGCSCGSVEEYERSGDCSSCRFDRD